MWTVAAMHMVSAAQQLGLPTSRTALGECDQHFMDATQVASVLLSPYHSSLYKKRPACEYTITLGGTIVARSFKCKQEETSVRVYNSTGWNYCGR